jgi:hypothetical protein
MDNLYTLKNHENGKVDAKSDNLEDRRGMSSEVKPS